VKKAFLKSRKYGNYNVMYNKHVFYLGFHDFWVTLCMHYLLKEDCSLQLACMCICVYFNSLSLDIHSSIIIDHSACRQRCNLNWSVGSVYSLLPHDSQRLWLPLWRSLSSANCHFVTRNGHLVVSGTALYIAWRRCRSRALRKSLQETWFLNYCEQVTSWSKEGPSWRWTVA
jgi:hypothetical protein